MTWAEDYARSKSGPTKGQLLDEVPDDGIADRVAVGAFAGTDSKRTAKEGHDSFIHRLETSGHSPDRARAIANRCARKYDSR